MAPDDETVKKATRFIREKVLTDRALHDAAQRSFVSHVRAYSKHEAKSIFRVAEINWGDLGRMWGLLKFPRMPELKGRLNELEDGLKSEGIQVDWETFKYKHAEKERKRVEELQGRKNGDGDRSGGQNVKLKGPKAKKANAFSKNKDLQGEKVARKKKKAVKREKMRDSRMDERERRDTEEVERLIGRVREEYGTA